MNQPKSTEKPFAIPKQAVVEAFKKVRENQGGPGVDGCTIEEFESELRDRLYVTWNRMSSGSYVPPPVKVVRVPKPHGGGMRMLGVPDDRRQGRADGGGHVLGAAGGAPVSSGLLWLPAEQVGP